jgi:hypothetical protein
LRSINAWPGSHDTHARRKLALDAQDERKEKKEKKKKHDIPPHSTEVTEVTKATQAQITEVATKFNHVTLESCHMTVFPHVCRVYARNRRVTELIKSRN